MIKTVVVEDDVDLSTLLKEFLFSYHIDVTTFTNGKDALEALTKETFDVAILDLGLPEMSGFELCKQIAIKYSLPIIIFSARDNINDKLYAFELGADDYIIKTVEPIELVARIKAVCKRKIMPAKEESDTKEIFRIDENTMNIYKNEELLQLSHAEYDLLSFFLKNRFVVLDKHTIADALGIEQNARNIDMLISRLRHKIEEDPKKPQFLKNVWGEGYKFIC